MGTSNYAHLVYGYDIGGGDDEFRLHNLDEDGCLKVSWLGDDRDGDCDSEDIENRLLVAHGFTETEYWVPGFWDRKRQAEQEIGVSIEYCGNDSYSSYLLAACKVTTYGGPEAVDLIDLELQRVQGGWDRKLAWALEALEFLPKQEHPSWFLTWSRG